MLSPCRHTPALTADCCAAATYICGDGAASFGCEGCDDGDLEDGDGCDSNCTPTGCGNGVVTSGESCDDGDADDGDGCDSNCTVTACGNGVRSTAEACDDGNTSAGDGCSATCALELDKLTPGGGSKSTDCNHEWRIEPAPPLGSKGLPVTALTCVDDDPACDFGGAGDHACTFHIGLCFNVEDPRLVDDGAPLCPQRDVELATLKTPKQEKPKDAVQTAIRDQFETALSGLGMCIRGACSAPANTKGDICLVDDDCDSSQGEGVCEDRFAITPFPVEETNTCSDYMDIVVPLKQKDGVYSKSKQTLALKLYPTYDPVTGKDRKADSDKLKLLCLP